MQPQYPPQYATQAAPQYPAQPAYPAQYPVAPTYAPQPGQPYAPPVQQYPGYPAGYGAPAPAAPPAQPTATGSLDGYYAQPSTGGGKAWSFHNRPNGTTFVGIVARPITDADIQQQTDMTTGVPRTFKDGRPMFVMIVPLRVQPSPEFPDGVASWWVRGQARDELVRAMAEAGAPAGPPEAGAMVQVTKVSERAGRPGFNPSYQYGVVYTRPTGDPAQAVAPAAPAAPVQYGPDPDHGQGPMGYPPAVAQQYAPPVQYAAPPAQPQYAPPVAPVYAAPPAQPVYAAPPAQYAPPVQYAPAQDAYAVHMAGGGPHAGAAQALLAAPVAQAAPAGLTAEQQALMAQLTGASA